MKKLLLLFTFLAVIVISGVTLVAVSPYYFYNKILQNDHRSDWYSLPNFKQDFLEAGEPITGSSKELGNDDLWQKFHFMDIVIPMPVHNPFFYVSPVLAYDKETKVTNFGIKLYNEDNREISKLFFIPNRIFPKVLKSQNLFKLPLIEKELKKYNKKKVWKDIFTQKISGWNIPFSEMAYNLYIIQLRSKILPDRFKSYSLVEGTSTAIIELHSVNKDYTTELILTYSRGLIYSFLLLTEKGNEESKLVRYKFLNEVSFQGGSGRLAKILYLEFKGLEYKDKIDHKGMLYLLSAWTHSMNDKEFIREMIESLEKGTQNQRQLESLYAYSLDRYNTTFTIKNIEGLNISDEVLLKREVELEEIKERKALLNKPVEQTKKVELSEDEKVKRLLDEVKRNKKIDSNKIIID